MHRLIPIALLLGLGACALPAQSQGNVAQQPGVRERNSWDAPDMPTERSIDCYYARSVECERPASVY